MHSYNKYKNRPVSGTSYVGIHFCSLPSPVHLRGIGRVEKCNMFSTVELLLLAAMVALQQFIHAHWHQYAGGGEDGGR